MGLVYLPTKLGSLGVFHWVSGHLPPSSNSFHPITPDHKWDTVASYYDGSTPRHRHLELFLGSQEVDDSIRDSWGKFERIFGEMCWILGGNLLEFCGTFCVWSHFWQVNMVKLSLGMPGCSLVLGSIRKRDNFYWGTLWFQDDFLRLLGGNIRGCFSNKETWQT